MSSDYFGMDHAFPKFRKEDQFEDFMKGRFPNMPLDMDKTGYYYHDTVQIAWITWQGAMSKSRV